ncbi:MULTISPECIES: EAL domain-containing protein [Leucobacter]|uniref:EAL domain-containing protein n=1 Tax=Leucobacter TaxID=55968 RepID=UPI0006213FA8|nr:MULTISPECIES: EAL domain-containing protein [Leucobacter]KKI22779.1 hypothetical protein XM48_00190 [Leucobacter sp. Ag1]
MNDLFARTSDHAELRKAIEHGELRPALQPIASMRSGDIRGFEVLARWTTPDGRHIPPRRFVPAFEDAGLLDVLLISFLETVCGHSAELPGSFYLSFNLSPSQLSQREMAETILLAIEKTGFSPDRVQLEVTEQILPEGEAQSTFQRLQKHGIKMAMDDFGIGYSNFARLVTLPFQVLKLDARLTKGICSNRKQQSVVKALASLSQDLSLTTVAEGVECGEDAGTLRGLGCDLAQGWHLGRPRSLAAVAAWAKRT